MHSKFLFVGTLVVAGLAGITAASAQGAEQTPLIGRWDLTIQTPGGPRPSWLEIHRSGHATLVGRFVGIGGSARPIAKVEHSNGSFRFSIPRQWESVDADLVVEGKLSGDQLSGTAKTPEGSTVKWTGVRAPKLTRTGRPQWGKPIALFNGKNLDGWKSRYPQRGHGWVVENGLLRNAKPQTDLVTEQKFTDFKLRVEFRYPKGSNSGIYLRGRHEVQIEDNYGKDPDSHYIGGVYGFLEPRVNAARPAGEWQTMDITLVGREVTVVLNGEPIIVRQNIPGITGGALDSNEGEPGPLMLQGDHGPVEFRKVVLTPAK